MDTEQVANPEPMDDLVNEPIADLVNEPIEPMAEPEPVPEPMVEPVAEPVPEPMVQPVEPVQVSPIVEPVHTPAVVPVTNVSPSSVTPDQVWKMLVDEKSQVNWVLVGINAQKNLMVVGYGSGGLGELLTHFNDGEVQFGAIRVVGVDQQANVTSRRPKFVTIQYVGSRVSTVRRGSVLKVKPDIEKIFSGSALNIQFSSDLTLKTIAKALLAAGGAHKPVFYECGSDRVLVADLYS